MHYNEVHGTVEEPDEPPVLPTGSIDIGRMKHMPSIENERKYLQKAVQMIQEGQLHTRFNLEHYPLTARLWVEKIGEKYSLRLGIHEIGSDRLHSYFLLSGSQEEISQKLREPGIVDELTHHLSNLVLRWIQSDDD